MPDNATMTTDSPAGGPPSAQELQALQGTYTEVYPHIGHDTEGLRRLFRQFSFPGGTRGRWEARSRCALLVFLRFAHS